MPSLRQRMKALWANQRSKLTRSVSDVPEQHAVDGRKGGLLRRFMSWGGSSFPRRLVTVSVEGDLFRVVAFKGRRVVAWGQVEAPELHEVIEHVPEGEVDAEPADDAERQRDQLGKTDTASLEELLRGFPFRGGRHVVDLPFYLPLTRSLPLPSVGGRYMDRVVSTELMESIPFRAEEVDISWQTVTSERGQEVLANAVPRASQTTGCASSANRACSPRPCTRKRSPWAWPPASPTLWSCGWAPNRVARGRPTWCWCATGSPGP